VTKSWPLTTFVTNRRCRGRQLRTSTRLPVLRWTDSTTGLRCRVRWRRTRPLPGAGGRAAPIAMMRRAAQNDRSDAPPKHPRWSRSIRPIRRSVCCRPARTRRAPLSASMPRLIDRRAERRQPTFVHPAEHGSRPSVPTAGGEARMALEYPVTRVPYRATRLAWCHPRSADSGGRPLTQAIATSDRPITSWPPMGNPSWPPMGRSWWPPTDLRLVWARLGSAFGEQCLAAAFN
jgi:hypothetical protein